MHTMEQYSALEREEIVRHYTQLNKPDTKQKILHDSTYMSYLEQ